MPNYTIRKVQEKDIQHIKKLQNENYLTLVRQAVNAKVQVQYPTAPHIATVALTEIYDQPVPSEPVAKSVVIFGHGQLDRSPCGTGISATMATLYGRGELALGTRFTSESIIGTRFTGLLRREVPLGRGSAVDPVFTGAAFITGLQQFVVDPRDPVKYGFTMHDTPATSISAGQGTASV